MASVLAEVTVVGQVGKVYELRRTKDNRANVDFSVAVTTRRRDDSTGKWVDGDTTWHNIKAWGMLAENIEKSLKSGDRVMVKGYYTLRKEFTKDDGTVIPARNQFVATHVGLELAFDPAHSERKSKNGGSNGNYSNSTSSASQSSTQTKSAPAEDKNNLDDLTLDDDFDLDLDSPF